MSDYFKGNFSPYFVNNTRLICGLNFVVRILEGWLFFGRIQTRNKWLIEEVTGTGEILSSFFLPLSLLVFCVPNVHFFPAPRFCSMLESVHHDEIYYTLEFYCNWQFSCPLSFTFYFLLKCLLPWSNNLCQWEQMKKRRGGVLVSVTLQGDQGSEGQTLELESFRTDLRANARAASFLDSTGR